MSLAGKFFLNIGKDHLHLGQIVEVCGDDPADLVVGRRRPGQRQQGRRVEALRRELDRPALRDGRAPREEVVERPLVAGRDGRRAIRGDRERGRDGTRGDHHTPGREK